METNEPDVRRHLEGKLKNKDLQSLLPQHNGLDTLSEWIDGATVQTLEEDNVGNTSQVSTGFAWSLYHHTLELFSLLFPLTLAWSVPSYNRQREKSFKRSLGRLLLWGDGFRNGKLESVLEESEDLKETVITSLAAIGRVLLFKLVPQCLGNSTPSKVKEIRQEVQDLEVLIEKAQTIIESDYESDESSLTSDESTEDSSLEIVTALKTYIDCLMELLPSMEETLNSLDYHEFEDKLDNPMEFQVSGPAHPYVLKVYDKYAKAEMRLIQRLGEANWQRHTSLRTRGDQLQEERPVQEVPKAVFTAVSMFHDSGLGSSLPAHSTYAATIASHSSFKSTTADKDNGDLRVPPTPKEVFEGVPFVCQICGHTLSRIKNRIDWRRHVFADLKPYICTFSGCKDEFKTFPTRNLWEEHEFNQHRLNTYWSCANCPSKLSTAESWRAHLKLTHNLNLSDDQYQIAARSAETSEPQPIELQSCPLCLQIPGKSRRNFVTHVGKHMEGIALAACPREEESTDSESSLSSIPSNLSEGAVPPATVSPVTPSRNSSTLSINQIELIANHIIKPLLAKSLFLHFQLMLADCLKRMREGDMICIRDLEKTLLIQAPGISKTAEEYSIFSLTAINLIQTAVQFFSVTEQTRPHDRPYTNGYFLDLADQIKQVAANFDSIKAESGNSQFLSGMDAQSSVTPDIIPRSAILTNSNNFPSGPIEDSFDVLEEDDKNEAARDEEAIMQSMARRKKSASAAELAPKQCRMPGCNKEFKRPCDLTKHEKTHSAPWKCPITSCRYHEYGWPTEKEMDRHYNDKHSTPPVLYECIFKPCNYKSKRESNCKQHMNKAHGWEYIRKKDDKNPNSHDFVPPIASSADPPEKEGVKAHDSNSTSTPIFQLYDLWCCHHCRLTVQSTLTDFCTDVNCNHRRCEDCERNTKNEGFIVLNEMKT